MNKVTLLPAIKIVEIKLEVQSQEALFNENNEVANTNQKGLLSNRILETN